MSFINSIFLFATAAAVLPVLYHLVRRMRAKTVPFSSLMFLKATPKELIRKRRLKDKLLMLARAAMLALLALVFARPYLPAEQIPFVPQRESESVVVLIDRSLSMRHDGAFERALEAARARLDGAAPGDEISVITFDDQVQVLSQLETDPTSHVGALNALEPGYRTTDFFPALQQAEDLLQEARHPRRLVVMISDFQETGWTGSFENWKLQRGTVFEPISVARDDVDNAYVDAFEVSTRTTEEGEAVRFDARISAAGGTAERDRCASLELDGAEVDRQSLPGRASAPVSFQQYITREGYYQGSVSLEEDNLPADDRYYFTGRMEGRPGIFVVDAPSAAGARDAFYLRNAFELGDASRFSFSAADRVEGAALRDANVVFLARETTDVEASALRSFVEDGGTLVLSPGAEAGGAGLTRNLALFDVGEVEEIVDARAQLGYEVIIGEIEMRHPIFEPFGSSGRAAILRPQFRRFARLAPAEGTTVLGRFDSGDVFLAERSVGSGRVLFYASTLNTGWTDLPLDEMYVPFLYQLVSYGIGASDLTDIFLIGDVVALSGSPAETIEVRAPGDRLYRVTLDEEGAGYFRETETPGQYAAAGRSETRYFSVNVDPGESDLRRRDAEEAYAAVAPPSEDVPSTPQEAAVAVIETDERSQKLWRVLLITVLALFIIETYAANRRSQKPAATGVPLREPRS